MTCVPHRFSLLITLFAVLAAMFLPKGSTAMAVEPQSIWQPQPGTTWQWQLTTPVDTSVAAQVFDIDLFDNDAAMVASLHAAGKRVICYMSAGSWENWRPDAASYAPAVLGRALDGWPGERWLDIRRLDLLGPIIAARLDQCAAKGFDGVEFDNIDGYTNATGFPLTSDDQLAFNRWLANAAHARGLAAGLKNDLDQIPALVDVFDFAIDEQCFQYNECDTLLPFVQSGKAVLQVEYDLQTAQFCPQVNQLGFSSMRKQLDLGVYREPCADTRPSGLKHFSFVSMLIGS